MRLSYYNNPISDNWFLYSARSAVIFLWNPICFFFGFYEPQSSQKLLVFRRYWNRLTLKAQRLRVHFFDAESAEEQSRQSIISAHYDVIEQCFDKLSMTSEIRYTNWNFKFYKYINR